MKFPGRASFLAGLLLSVAVGLVHAQEKAEEDSERRGEKIADVGADCSRHDPSIDCRDG